MIVSWTNWQQKELNKVYGKWYPSFLLNIIPIFMKEIYRVSQVLYTKSTLKWEKKKRKKKQCLAIYPKWMKQKEWNEWNLSLEFFMQNSQYNDTRMPKWFSRSIPLAPKSPIRGRMLWSRQPFQLYLVGVTICRCSNTGSNPISSLSFSQHHIIQNVGDQETELITRFLHGA